MLMQVPHFPTDQIALKLATSLGLGLLVGFEREWANKDVGVRTFALISLFGMSSTLIGLPLAIGGLVAVVVLTAAMNARSIAADRSLEITTSAALLVTYVLGVLVGLGHLFTPVASAILMTMLLAWKTELQRIAGGVRPEEIRSAVLLGLLGFVIYPILPNRFIDPWQLINPREAWVTVIVVAALGFFNYILLRLYGTRGLFWSASLGGLVNSTAAISELAASLSASGLAGMIVFVNLLTVMAMFVRNLALIAMFQHRALATAVFPLAVMAAFGGMLAWKSRRTSESQDGRVKLTSPVSLGRVLQFGALFLVIEVVAVLASRKFGRAGFLVVSAIGGLFSSASSTVAAANLASRGSVSAELAGTAAILASLASAVVNIPVIAKQAKSSSIIARVASITALQMVAGLGAIIVQHFLMKFSW
jgi:uncharacterized membrane protein (DUF4010 family)